MSSSRSSPFQDTRLQRGQYQVLPAKSSASIPKTKHPRHHQHQHRHHYQSRWPQSDVEQVVQYYLRSSEPEANAAIQNIPLFCPCCEDRNAENAARGTRNNIQTHEYDPIVEQNIGLYRPQTTVLQMDPAPQPATKDTHIILPRPTAYPVTYRDPYNPKRFGLYSPPPPPIEMNESIFAANARYRLAMDKLGKSVDRLEA